MTDIKLFSVPQAAKEVMLKSRLIRNLCRVEYNYKNPKRTQLVRIKMEEKDFG